MLKFSFKFAPIGLCLLLIAGCADRIPKEALQLSPDSLTRRQTQTRIFETPNEAELLSASAALLQDLGFNLDESETELGVIVGSKERDATEAGQVAASIAVARADARIMSRSSWRSSFHHTRSRISAKFCGAGWAGGMPRASAE